MNPSTPGSSVPTSGPTPAPPNQEVVRTGAPAPAVTVPVRSASLGTNVDVLRGEPGPEGPQGHPGNVSNSTGFQMQGPVTTRYFLIAVGANLLVAGITYCVAHRYIVLKTQISKGTESDAYYQEGMRGSLAGQGAFAQSESVKQ